MSQFIGRVGKFILSVVFICAALPTFANSFTISTIGTLPTQVRTNGGVLAHFLIKNNTAVTQSGFSIKHIPTQVVQYTGATRYTQYTACSRSINLIAGGRCLLSLKISGAASFTFSLCKSSSCTTSGIPVSITTTSLTDPNFPYGSAPSGDVCNPSSVSNYATPETMLGSWAMLSAANQDSAAGTELPSFLVSSSDPDITSNVVYAVGTAAVGVAYGIPGCDKGCNQLNGQCFAIKFKNKTPYPYMIFQSVNTAVDYENTFDIYMAGGGSGNFPDSCAAFWGTTGTEPWATPGAACNALGLMDSDYTVSYGDAPHGAVDTLTNACNFMNSAPPFAPSGNDSFPVANYGYTSDGVNDGSVKVVPVTCPSALTQVTGLFVENKGGVIGNQNILTLSDLQDDNEDDSDFNAPYATTIYTTSMQDCVTPSSGWCNNNNSTSRETNYESSISASLTEPLLVAVDNTAVFCAANPTILGYCSWNGCYDWGSDPSGWCNSSESNCLGCGNSPMWCSCETTLSTASKNYSSIPGSLESILPAH